MTFDISPANRLFIIYAFDLGWLFLWFIYAFVLIMAAPFGIVINPRLNIRQAFACLVVIASWTNYIGQDAMYSYGWICDGQVPVADADIINKAWRELQSLITSILTTLLITGYKFGGE